MKIKDLPAPVTASKASWTTTTTWMGFSPASEGRASFNKCQSTVNRQFSKGYVIEYISKTFHKPNAGFENDPEYLYDRERHKELAGRLIAVHKLQTTARPLEEILGEQDFKHLQDKWAENGKRFRWSVAFPVIESYEIVGQPEAELVLGTDGYRQLYQQASRTLRVLEPEEQEALQELELEPVPADNAWIGIEDEIAWAERSEIDPKIERLIGDDLDGALEGETEERRRLLRKRAAWLAEKFVKQRRRDGMLTCDDCGFDPAHIFDNPKDQRSILDVHHKNPLAEGKRYTNENDFSLLCPTCHRIEHVRIKQPQHQG